MEERIWQLQDAGKRLGELIERTASGEAQIIAKHGKPAAVLISAEQYDALKHRSAMADFVQHLLTAPKGNFVAPRRNKHRRFDQR